MSELKPCPFCGTKSPVLNEYVPMSGYSYYYVECKNKKCHVNPVTNNFGTEEEAIKAWNTRVERTCQMKKARWDDGQCTWGVICSACGEKHEHEFEYSFNFCPTCGVKVVVP